MTSADTNTMENHAFEADVSRLLHMMVHSVYSDRDVFLRELISNAADACEKLRYEAIATPSLLSDDPAARIVITLDEDAKTLTIEDNGIGMSKEELIQALGTIAHSGTRAFMERFEAARAGEGAQLIGQFGVGFYSAFMVAERVHVISRRAGGDDAWIWSSDGKGEYSLSPAGSDAPARGTRIVLHLLEDADQYLKRSTVERIVKQQSGHVPVPILIRDKPDQDPDQIGDGSALWTRSKGEISEDEYRDFYRSVSGQYDEPALNIHFRAEGRQEYTALVYVPGTPPFDLFDPDRAGRMKLYVKRVFITDEAELLPRYLRFMRGLVDTSDLPLNMSREMIQESPLLGAIRKGVTSRILSALEKQAKNEPDSYAAIWRNFGSVLKEGIYEDFERKSQLLGLARFRTSKSGEGLRSLADYIADMKDGQDAIYYLTGDSLAQVQASPQLEGFRSRDIEVLYLVDPIDSFWAPSVTDHEEKPFKSVTQGQADFSKIDKTDGKDADKPEDSHLAGLISRIKTVLGEELADVRASDRLTESPVCLVASEFGPDRQLEKLLQGAGRLDEASKPVLEVNPGHQLIKAMAGSTDSAFQDDMAWLLLDQARILDGGKPRDPQGFSARMTRLFQEVLKT